MPRTARAIIAGHCYHIINRGNNRATVFRGDASYNSFIDLLGEASDRIPMPLIGACLMPNHPHIVVRPTGADDLAKWMHWIFTTHVRRHHAKHGSSGRIWQGRFKAFIIQNDSHLLTVLRYVERNALRANLVSRAEDWPWGSLHWRTSLNPPITLAPSPVPLPKDWVRLVNSPQSTAELNQIRTSVNRQRPFGDRGWVEYTAERLGLTHSLRPLGRPPR